MKKKIDLIKTDIGIKIITPDKYSLAFEKIPRVSPQFIIFIAQMIMLLSIIIMWTKQ